MNRMQERDRQSVWHPYTQSGIEQAPIVIERSSGSYLYDADGRAFLDGISSWWVALHGHSHPHISEMIRRQMERMHHVVFAGCTHEPAIALSERLVQILPGDQGKIFFTDNGSSAVEASIKMALQYWQNIGQPERRKFISLENGYHGDTLGAMSVGGKTFFNRPFHELLFDSIQIPCPYEDCLEAENALEVLLSEGGVAAFVYEPLLQGAAGMKVYPAENLDRLLAICRKHDVLLIADEVFTGFYKTGKCFASEFCTTRPDIILLSKALTGGSLPMAVLSATNKVFDAFVSNSRENMFLHGHTFTANPLACAASLASLDLIADNSFLAKVERIHQSHIKFADNLQKRADVENVRVLGMLIAFEITVPGVSDYRQPIRDIVFAACLKRGLFLRPLGNTVYLLPPSVATSEELLRMYTVIEEVLNELSAGAC